MMQRLAILILVLLCTGCNGSAQYFVLYKQGQLVPDVVSDDTDMAVLAADFCTRFREVTGTKPELKTESEAKTVIELKLGKKDGYAITQNGSTVTIEAQNIKQMAAAMQYFFAEFAGAVNQPYKGNTVTEIKVPEGLQYEPQLAFEYREPYFPDNFDANFRKWNNTQTLEENWALWGHNIGKAVKVTPEMLARVNGKVNEDQFCFSSPELEKALMEFVRAKTEEDSSLSKFMIMPNDNMVVCQCDACKEHGNTAKSASPAVFSLLNKLAKEFPEQQFFSTAYMTTLKAPDFSLEDNTGVMISSMDFQKGVDFNKVPAAKNKVDKTFEAWKKVADKIYLWDYAVNFDNYFDAYPTLLVAQQNLKYYKELGVTGVFMHGSEEYFSVFGDLKTYIYAQLLQNPDLDVKKHIKAFFDSKYPSVSKLLYDYYTAIEQRAFDSKKPLDIYGGIKQSYAKYLDDAELKAFYDALSEKAATLPNAEKERLNGLLASLAYQRLEVMRTNAFEDNGYGEFDYKNKSGKATQKAKQLLKQFEVYAKAAGIKVYNESALTPDYYAAQWNDIIINKQYKNLLYGKTITNGFDPEEDAQNINILTDGNLGFNDYYNNWFIATANGIKVDVKPADVKGAKTVEMVFLSDTRHNIYTPQKVVVTVDGRKYEKAITANNSREVTKTRVSIPIELKNSDRQITIETVKQDEYKTKSVASDEIYFK